MKPTEENVLIWWDKRIGENVSIEPNDDPCTEFNLIFEQRCDPLKFEDLRAFMRSFRGFVVVDIYHSDVCACLCVTVKCLVPMMLAEDD